MEYDGETMTWEMTSSLSAGPETVTAQATSICPHLKQGFLDAFCLGEELLRGDELWQEKGSKLLGFLYDVMAALLEKEIRLRIAQEENEMFLAEIERLEDDA